jgi:2-iminobutanoate/2-iminopropanoate deaminase
MRHKALIAVTLAALAVGAEAQQATAPRREIRLSSRTDDRPFSDGVFVGNTLYVAGKLGLDAKTQKPPADPADEARNALDAVKTVLTEAGLTMDDLVSVTVFCSDVAHYDTFNNVYRTYFKKGFPARAFIGSGPLLFGARFEIVGIAAKR